MSCRTPWSRREPIGTSSRVASRDSTNGSVEPTAAARLSLDSQTNGNAATIAFASWVPARRSSRTSVSWAPSGRAYHARTSAPLRSPRVVLSMGRGVGGGDSCFYTLCHASRLESTYAFTMAEAFRRAELSRLLQLLRGACQDLDQLGFRVGVVLQPLARGLAQVLERGAHQRRQAAVVVALFVAAEAPAHARDLGADRGEALQHRLDEVAVLVEIGAALVGDRVELLAALGLRRHVAGLFQISEGRVDDARARRVPAGGLVLQHLDDLVAVARLLADQRKRDQPQITGRQHAAGAHHVAAEPAPPAPAAKTVPVASASCRPAAVAARFRMSHAVHRVGLLFDKKIYLKIARIRCSGRYILKNFDDTSCHYLDVSVYPYTDIRERISPDGEEIPSRKSLSAGGAGAAVRAADASLRDGGDPQAAAQGGQHQAALRVALHRDRAAAGARLYPGAGDLARRPAAGAYRLRADRCGPRRALRLDARPAARPGQGISAVRGGALPDAGAAAGRGDRAPGRSRRASRRPGCAARGAACRAGTATAVGRGGRRGAAAGARGSDKISAAVHRRGRIPARHASRRARIRHRAHPPDRRGEMGSGRSVARYSGGRRQTA